MAEVIHLPTVVRDPVKALTEGRTHYWRPVLAMDGEPEVGDVLHALSSDCESQMKAIEGGEGQIIGYQCPACGTLASVTGRTEHGPRFLSVTGKGVETVLTEPDEDDEGDEDNDDDWDD